LAKAGDTVAALSPALFPCNHVIALAAKRSTTRRMEIASPACVGEGSLRSSQ